MAPILSFLLLLLLVPFSLSAYLTKSVLESKQVIPRTLVSPASLPADNVTLLHLNSKPNPLTDGFVCTRNAECALAAYEAKCGNPPDIRILGCMREYPAAGLCCGRSHGKDHPCTRFWPESHIKCQEQMKHHDCHRVRGKAPFCEPINTNETPEQCTLKTHCAAKDWEKACGKWYQRLFHPSSCGGEKPEYQYCCLPKWMRPPFHTRYNLPSGCKQYWPKDVNKCAKGCKVHVGGEVTCSKEKRDTNAADGTSFPIVDPANASMSSSAAENVTIPIPSASNTTVCKREERSWVDGDPIPPVTDCKFGTRCALATWKENCDKWWQKLSPGCWDRAPAYHKCCNARGEKKPPQNDACKVRWPSNMMWCQDTLRAWDCRDDAKGGLVCERIPGIPRN